MINKKTPQTQEEKRKIYNKIMKTKLSKKKFIEQCKLEGVTI